MNLNDPFNRLSRKQQNEYVALRASLKKSSINTQSEVEALLKNIHQRALIFTTLVIISAISILLFLPKLKVFVIILSVLSLLWLMNITIKGQSYIKRYIKEEFE